MIKRIKDKKMGYGYADVRASSAWYNVPAVY